MEYENKYASNGKGNAALTLGIIGTGLAALGGGLNGVLGMGNGHCGCSENTTVSRYELDLQQKIAERDTRISLLESNVYVDSKIADVYERLNTKVGALEAQLCQQNVYNATNTAAISCIQSQIAQLAGLTKIVVPNTSVCPGWGDVTVSVTPTTAGA